MDFDLTSEQRLLKDSVARWAADTYAGLDRVEASRSEPLGFSEAHWGELAELGLLGLPFSEADGGFGGGPVETMVVMEALGRVLAPEPYLASVILGGAALRLAGDAAQRARLIPQLAGGRLRLAFAHGERQARYDLEDVATTARPEAGGYVLDGAKGVVLNADAAGLLVVSARTAGGRREGAGISLFLVPTDTPGLTLRPYPTQDGGRAADVILRGVQVPSEALLGPADGALPIIEQVIDGAIAAVAAEAVGLMEALQDLTVAYLKTRKQFGTAIGGFQALQHRAVDMLVALEQARSMELYATMMVEAEAEARGPALSAAKVQINRSARFVGQQAVQLHGGIGMTQEYLGAHQFRRLTMIEILFGDTAHHLRRVTRAGGLLGAA
jgi:pimeloyl-CoA dehydrogenase small subunit